MFSGPMLAQIEGLNTCSSISNESPLVGDTGSGTATLELQENCETAFIVEIRNVPEESYDLYMDGVYGAEPAAIINTEDDGLGVGTRTGFVRFDPTPDGDELPLDFTVGTGSLVEVFDEEADPTVDLPVLSGTIL
jgi:hypothetical protein